MALSMPVLFTEASGRVCAITSAEKQVLAGCQGDPMFYSKWKNQEQVTELPVVNGFWVSPDSVLI